MLNKFSSICCFLHQQLTLSIVQKRTEEEYLNEKKKESSLLVSSKDFVRNLLSSL